MRSEEEIRNQRHDFQMTFLLSGFLIVGGFFLLSFVLVLLGPKWQPLFGIPALLFIIVGSLTFIRELIALHKWAHNEEEK